jgi:cytoskeletal protein CcmA (bactofilin family)
MSILSAIGRFLGISQETSPESVIPDLPKSGNGGLIGESMSVKGEISGEGDIQILGRFEGEITLTGTVLVGNGAEVDGNISAATVVIGGTVRGNLSASARVEILPSGVLTGSLKSGSLTAAEGARVKGEVWVERSARPLAGISEGTARAGTAQR